LASLGGHVKIVELLLNTFHEEEKDKLIEFMMKEDNINHTALHLSSLKGHEKIVELLLNIFNEEEKDKLIAHVINADNTALHLALLSTENPQITDLLKYYMQ